MKALNHSGKNQEKDKRYIKVKSYREVQNDRRSPTTGNTMQVNCCRKDKETQNSKEMVNNYRMKKRRSKKERKEKMIE